MTKSERYTIEPMLGIINAYRILEDGCQVAEVGRPGRGDENEATAGAAAVQAVQAVRRGLELGLLGLEP